ncbi:MAG: hypothetical protein ACXW1F_05855 [Halobacteriota archaeon]
MIYKRTHKGDPGTAGIFGINDCMGKVRDREYDAVIGIGGKSPWIGDKDIAFKINWIGIYPKKYKCPPKRGSCVTFGEFFLFEEKGPLVREIAPNLYEYMYCEPKSDYRRVVMSYSLPEVALNEVTKILNMKHDCKTAIIENLKKHPIKKCR